MLGMNPLTLLKLIFEPHFQTGFLTGILAVAVLILVRKAGWFLLWGTAAVLGLAWAGVLRTNPASPAWSIPAVAVTVVTAAFSFQSLMRRMQAWAAGAAFALWALGVWGTVPDTERAMVTMGVTAALVLCLWPRFRIRVGWEGILLAASVLGFVTIADGAARPVSIVGALGMVGMPLAAAIASSRLRPQKHLPPFWFVGAMAMHVIVCGRVAGQLFDLLGALTIVVLSALLTGAGLVLVLETMERSPKP